MANKAIFKSIRGKTPPPADTVNEAGGVAYKLGPEAALATMAATCTFGDAYYLNAEQQLDHLLQVAKANTPEFVAKTAVFARTRGFMKDAPALLTALLPTMGEEGRALFKKIFGEVVDNGRELRTFVQVCRSGATGRKSLGTVIKRKIQEMLARVPANVLFRWSVGNDPSLGDIVKMVHPKPDSPEKEALYGYLLKKEHSFEKLPGLVKLFEEFKKYKEGKTSTPVAVPPVPFQMLDNLALTAAEWSELFKTGGWHFVRMNLNTAKRHGVFEKPEMVNLVAKRLADRDEILRSRVFPYQLLMAYNHAAENMPRAIGNALHAALDVSVDNIPEMNGSIAVCIDTSGSMGMPATGYRGSATSAASCVEIAALFAAAIMRRNKADTKIVPFDDQVHSIHVDPNDSILTNARKLARNGGGTNCACALSYLNQIGHKGELVIYVSDNEAWIETPAGKVYRRMFGGVSGMATEWAAYKSRNHQARLVNVNIQPYTTSQMPDVASPDVYQVAGFSDQIFRLVGDWLAGRGPEHWVETIKAINLDAAVEVVE